MIYGKRATFQWPVFFCVNHCSKLFAGRMSAGSQSIRLLLECMQNMKENCHTFSKWNRFDNLLEQCARTSSSFTRKFTSPFATQYLLCRFFHSYWCVSMRSLISRWSRALKGSGTHRAITSASRLLPRYLKESTTSSESLKKGLWLQQHGPLQTKNPPGMRLP